jgi:hypothetical protein
MFTLGYGVCSLFFVVLRALCVFVVNLFFLLFNYQALINFALLLLFNETFTPLF